MEVAGTMWFFRKIVEGRETTRHFWTEQIEEWARTIEDSYNENLIDEDVRLNVRIKVFAKSSEVYFEYITEN